MVLDESADGDKFYTVIERSQNVPKVSKDEGLKDTYLIRDSF